MVFELGFLSMGVQDVGTIDSETPKRRADRKAAIRRQHALLLEDIKNLNARAVQQVGRRPRRRRLAVPGDSGFY